MRHFRNPIHVREEFYYEVLLPYFGAGGWRYEISTEEKEMHVTLKALTDDAGKEHSVATARKLIQRLQKGARLSPYYVYSYKGTYDERLDGHWDCRASPDIRDATELAERMLKIPNMGTVRIYRNTETRESQDWDGEVKGRRPYKVRAVKLHGYFDIALWEIDCRMYDTACLELSLVLEDMEAVGAVYVCISEWRAHGTDRR